METRTKIIFAIAILACTCQAQRYAETFGVNEWTNSYSRDVYEAIPAKKGAICLVSKNGLRFINSGGKTLSKRDIEWKKYEIHESGIPKEF